MQNKITFFIKFTIATLVLLYLLVAAGSIVRATGSGMGCPDWPKCFGYLIPPTDISTLTYKQGRAFEKGQMVILNDTLWVATKAVKAEGVIDRNIWIKYPKHDYSTFNAQHTWIEYINRLIGALTGLFVFVMFILSVRLKHKSLMGFTFAIVLLTGFQAWLGAKVVDSNLAPVKITIHMAMAFVIVLLVVYVLFKLKHIENRISHQAGIPFKGLLYALLFVTFIQMMVGTQVRQQVDRLSHSLAAESRQTWVDELGNVFLTHKNLAVLLLAVTFYVMFKMKKADFKIAFPMNALIAITIGEFMVGLGLNYLGLPAYLQPIHLLLSSMILSIQFYLLMLVVNTDKRTTV
jgi:cytochrome c oxidase assembly protein subunit 15